MISIEQAAAALRRRETTCVALTEQCLRQIEAENPRLNAFLTVTAESALADAAARDRELADGRDRGPLHGIPYALKDMFCTRGIRTTAGSLLFADFVPDYDAAVAERLSATGAVLVGKTNMHELAYGITSNNPHFGPVRNPCDPARIPGGSSGGSAAAVAAGMCLFSLGSDTGGSIRVPASFCGIVGLKPTSGRVSRYGTLPLDFTLDHMGPLTLTVQDAALVLQAIAGHDPRDDSSAREPVDFYLPEGQPSLQNIRIGVPAGFLFDRLEPSVESCVRGLIETAKAQGAQIVEVTLPDMATVNLVGRVILLSEAAAVTEPYRQRRAEIGPDVLALLDQGRLLRAADYVNAQRLRRLLQQEMDRVWTLADCLLTSTAPTPAPLIGQNMIAWPDQEEDVRLASTRLVRGWNVLGCPAISVPCGVSGGLPVGAQLIGPPFEERALLRTAAALCS